MFLLTAKANYKEIINLISETLEPLKTKIEHYFSSHQDLVNAINENQPLHSSKGVKVAFHFFSKNLPYLR